MGSAHAIANIGTDSIAYHDAIGVANTSAHGIANRLAERSSVGVVHRLTECSSVGVAHRLTDGLAERSSASHVGNGCLFLMECCAVDVLCSWRHTCQRKLSHREHMQTPCAPPEYGRQISSLTLKCNLEICTYSISGARAAGAALCSLG